MASPPIPPLWDDLGRRPFSFYPPIANVEHNEWIFRKATWSEIQVINSRSGEVISIPRRHVGEPSHFDDTAVVGLCRKLEWKGGRVVPCQRRILAMPPAVDLPAQARRSAPAQVVSIRLERRGRRAFRVALIAVAALTVLYLVLMGLLRLGELRQNELRQKRSGAHPPRERFEADALLL